MAPAHLGDSTAKFQGFIKYLPDGIVRLVCLGKDATNDVDIETRRKRRSRRPAGYARAWGCESLNAIDQLSRLRSHILLGLYEFPRNLTFLISSTQTSTGLDFSRNT